jgi:hypothetical protein|nr:MAG TPA: 50S ribosomal protein L13 [Caudoviricetes sp.]
MTPLDIIEEYFTKSDYVAFLRGSIIMYLLEDKPLDTVKFKLHTDKLVDALDKEQVEKIDVYRPTVTPQIKSFDYTEVEPTVDLDEPQVQPTTIDEPRAYEFKIGDRVVVSKGTDDERTGTIIRLPRDNSRYQEYIVELDDKTLGWEATIAKEGVSCKNAWYACKGTMTLLEPSIKGSLEVGKWYHTTDFTVEELSALLPKGTIVETEQEVLYAGIETEPPTKTVTKVVEEVTISMFGDKALIVVTESSFLKEWFKILQENK